MKEAVALLILFHIIAGIGATVAAQRKTARLLSEPRWVTFAPERWPDMDKSKNIEDLRGQ